MQHVAVPDPTTVDAIHRIWDDLAVVPAAAPERGLALLLERIGALIEARHGLWLSSCRLDDCSPDDVLCGWRACSVYFFGELPADDDAYRRAVKKLDQTGASASASSADVDESTRRHVREAGTFRARRLVEHVSPEHFESEFFARHYLDRGIRDRLFAVLPVSPDAESYFMFDRMYDQPAFEAKDRDIAAYALRSLTWFARHIHLSYGQLIADSPLTPTERQVLRFMLKGSAEKIIARDTNQSPHTTHVHVKRIFKKFNVGSRSELMALWLGG